MTQQITIARRFRGPARSGNGGYSAGLVAEAFGGAAEVTLRKPPPLDRPLDLVRDGDRIEVCDGDALVAEARPAGPMDDVIPPRTVTLEEAADATSRYAGHEAHLFPECFTCGPAREAGDGLRIFPGPVGDGLLAATWAPDPSVSADGRTVRSAALWAALDCPSGWAGELSAARPAVLGRIAVDVRRDVEVGQPLVVLGWPVEDQPKKFHCGAAILDADGEVMALARATWVRIDPAAWQA